jgi:hypothetical protein
MREVLASKQITVMEHPPYSLNLALNEFFCSEDKGNIERRAFDNIDNIRINTKVTLKVISQNQFQNCFEGRTRCWYRCIASQGKYTYSYIEGDHSDIQQ